MRLELVTCIVRGKNFPIILTTTIYNSLGHCTLRLFFKAHAQRMLQPRSADTKMFCPKTHMSRISGYARIISNLLAISLVPTAKVLSPGIFKVCMLYGRFIYFAVLDIFA